MVHRWMPLRSAEGARARRQLAAVAVVLVGLTGLPVLLSPEVPPLDLANHLGRIYILSRLGEDAGLRALYDVAWQPTPNLAADLLLTPLLRWIEPRLALRLFCGVSLLVVAAAFAAVCRVGRGRWDAAALLGVPLSHGLAFNYGFINYHWGIAAALGSYAVWLRLYAPRPTVAAVATVVPLALITYLMHLVGFGTLVVATSASVVADALGRLRQPGVERRTVLLDLLGHAAGVALMATPPLVLYWIFSRGAVGAQGLGAGVIWTAPRDKVLGILRVLRAGRPLTDLPLLGLVAAASLVGLGRARRGLSAARRRVLAAGAALLLLALALPSAFDLETADIDLRVALPALLLGIAALAELPERPAWRRAALGLLVVATALRGAGALARWRLASEGIADSRALCDVLPAGARVVTLHNEVPPPGEVEHEAGERHGWAYCLLRRPLFFPALFHQPGSQPLRLRLPAYEGDGSLARYHVRNGFSNPQQAHQIPWAELWRLSDYLWLSNWELSQADPAQRLPRGCVEEVGRRRRVVVYRFRRGGGCPLTLQ
ncbi:MAG: hypothetical protein RMK29_11080 [Myxococcales bacterium]|nr:hypothetical protein [Myxococcota bacterium]MDW8282249.1 hypothetical protein [Myxococcales bacterium]